MRETDPMSRALLILALLLAGCGVDRSLERSRLNQIYKGGLKPTRTPYPGLRNPYDPAQ